MHYERGADARIGRRRLALLIVLSLVLEAGYLTMTLPWVKDWRELLILGGRLMVIWSLLVALWSGAGWTRWLLALLCFGVGGWLLLQALGNHILFIVPGLRWWWLARLLPPALGTLYLAAAGWLAFSADLETFVVEQRAKTTRGDRWAVGALLTLCLGLPLAGGGWWAARALTAENEQQTVYRQAQRDGRPGGEFALGLMREAVRRGEFSVIREAMRRGYESNPEPPASVQAWRVQAARLETALQSAGTVSRVELGNILPMGDPHNADAFLCKVIVTGTQRSVSFDCYVYRRPEPPGWHLGEVSD